MRPTEALRLKNEKLWQDVTQHAFCKELADSSLPIEKMKYYLIQDYMFVDGFVRLLASAIAHAPSLKDSVPAAQFLAVITGPENTYFLRAFEALGITEADWNITPDPATKQFQGLMTEAATSGQYEQMLAVLVVAEWTYLTWATPFNPPHKDQDFWFAEWITLHAGEGFESVVEYLRDQLDQVWNTLDDAAKLNVEATFAKAVQFEKDFFDQSYQAK